MAETRGVIVTYTGFGAISLGTDRPLACLPLSSQHSEMLLQPWLLLLSETAGPETNRAVLLPLPPGRFTTRVVAFKLPHDCSHSYGGDGLLCSGRVCRWLRTDYAVVVQLLRDHSFCMMTQQCFTSEAQVLLCLQQSCGQQQILCLLHHWHKECLSNE